MVSERVLSRSFVGRVPELDHLAMRRRAASQGLGGAVLIAGDAGVGKSRLVNEYRRRFASRGAAAVVTAGCRPFAQRPLDPIAAVLEQLGDSALAHNARTWSSREDLFDAIVAGFVQATNHRTRTIVLEDLHWADLELIQIVTVLAERAAHQRLLFIGTYRDNEIVPTSGIFTAFGRLTREPSVTLLDLEPLQGLEFAQFLTSLLADIDVAVPGEVLEDVRRRSGGNPLFAEELMRYAVDAQRSGHAAVRSLPISLHAVIRERLDRCSPPERALLSQASVFGRRFHLDLLGAVFTFDDDAGGVALRRLRDLQLIDPVEGDSNAYEFRHALTRDAVYAELLPSEAQRLHERVAEIVETHPDSERHVELLAHSFWEAGQRDRAAPHCEAAGDEAQRLHAYADAILWYERAGAGFGNDFAAARSLSKAAFTAVRLHDPERATPLHERAISLYTKGGWFEDAVRTSNSLAGTFFNNGRSERAIRLFRSAVQIATDSGDAGLRRDVLIRLFSAYAALRRVPDAQSCAAEIDEAAIDGNKQSAGEYYLARSSLHAQRGEVEPWRHCFAEALTILERIDRERFLVRYAHGTITRQAQDLGELDIARRHATLGLDLARTLRSDEAYMLALLTEIELRSGNLAAVRENLRAMPPNREFIARQSVAATTIGLALRSGDDDLLRSAIDLDLDLIDEADAGGNTFAVVTLATAFGLALRQLGRYDEAQVLLARATEGLTSSFGHVSEVAALAIACPSAIVNLQTVVERDPSTGRVRTAIAQFLRAAGARARVDEEQAQRFGAEAAAGFAAIGWPLLEAQSRELAGERNAALAVYRRLGAFGDIRRLERVQIPPAQASRTQRSVLTPRELDVARLVATGKGNHAIADALGISRKAVEKYLTATYEKLGITSRAQLAVYMTTVGAPEETAATAGRE